MDNNTRKYSRSLSEAFPDERASATEGWSKPTQTKGLYIVWAVCLVCYVLIAWGLS